VLHGTVVVSSAGSKDPAERAPFRRAGIALLVVAALGASGLGVRALTHGSTTATAHVGSSATNPGGIAGLQQRLREVPRDWNAWASLGSAYVQQARINGDPTYYPKAEEALRRSLALERNNNVQAFVGLGALAAARHNFSGALAWGNKAIGVDRYSSGAYGVVGDALIELGRYPQAFDALQHMVDLRPGLSSYARVSYAWELQGNIPNAVRALKLALQAASTHSDAAFASYYLGELAWNSGNTAEAARRYHLSAELDPTFVPAQQGLAKVAAARGDLNTAIYEYETVVTRLPLPQYVTELADLYDAAGMHARAVAEYGLLHVQERLFKANGVNIDLEAAIFDADHGIDLPAGLAAARAEWNRRHSVFVADALAWSLYANGRFNEALSYSERTMRLGTVNALFFFHRGMIERALHDDVAARRDLTRALAINAHFSFRWAPRARAILSSLR
jgi:tetratricopeptide (TPR) repeat protein